MFVVVLLVFAYISNSVFAPPQPEEVAAPAPQALLEERIVQKQSAPKPPLFSVDDEIKMACDEADCVRTCVHLSSSGEKIVDPVCRRNCGKTRCKRRCKRDVPVPYVERESRREQCIDRCDRQLPDASPKKPACLQVCEEESRKCSDRCKERARRFFCVRDLNLLPQEEDLDPRQFEDDAGPI